MWRNILLNWSHSSCVRVGDLESLFRIQYRSFNSRICRVVIRLLRERMPSDRSIRRYHFHFPGRWHRFDYAGRKGHRGHRLADVET